MGNERERELPESLLTPDIIQVLETDLLSETRALAERAQRILKGRERLLAIIPSLASLDMDDFKMEERMIKREPYPQERPPSERELMEFQFILFQMSNGDVVEIYHIDFYKKNPVGFTVSTHVDADSYERLGLREAVWNEERISRDDERYELAIGVALNKLIPLLTINETRDLDICLSFLEPTPEKSSE